MTSTYRRHFDTLGGSEVCVIADAVHLPAVTICVDRDDDEQVVQLTLDPRDAAKLRNLLTQALEALEAPETTSKEREAA